MRRMIQVALLSGALIISSMTVALAVDTPSPTATPTPHISVKAKPTRPALTQAQKTAIAVARSVYTSEKVNAQNGLSRALADAKAIRDQALVAAGADKKAQILARKTFRDSTVEIQTAFKAAMLDAKNIFQAALAAALAMH